MNDLAAEALVKLGDLLRGMHSEWAVWDCVNPILDYINELEKELEEERNI